MISEIIPPVGNGSKPVTSAEVAKVIEGIRKKYGFDVTEDYARDLINFVTTLQRLYYDEHEDR